MRAESDGARSGGRNVGDLRAVDGQYGFADPAVGDDEPLVLGGGCGRASRGRRAQMNRRSSTSAERVLYMLQSGEVFVVCRPHRMRRSLKHVIELMGEPDAGRIGYQSVTESIDTTTPGGKLMFHILGSLAEFERNLIRERT